MRPSLHKQNGFSLVELMIVVGMISILATMAEMNYQKFASRARYKRTIDEMFSIQHAIMGARVADDKTMPEETGSECTNCAGNPLSSWTPFGLSTQPKDVWNNFLQMDENEGEFGDTDCRWDAYWSIGQNGVWDGAGDGTQVFGDDIVVRVPSYRTNPNCGPNPEPLYQIGPDWKY